MNDEKIDVYSDECKGIKYIVSDEYREIRTLDFKKLEEESLKLEKINESTHNKKLLTINILLFVIIFVWGIYLTITASPYLLLGRNYIAGFVGWIFILTVFIYGPFAIIKKKIYDNKRREIFPQGTPEKIIENPTLLSSKNIEEILYKEYILILNGDFPTDTNCKVKKMGQIKSNESKKDLINKAYKIKAALLTNYQEKDKNYIATAIEKITNQQ